MTSKTSWVAGAGVGLSWTTLINSADMLPLTNGQSVLSTSTAGNATSLDMFMDISVNTVIASSATSSGANLAFWIYPLQQDGTTLGDGKLTAGTAASLTPPWAPAAVIPLNVGAAQTNLIGQADGIIIPPGTFAVTIQNNSGYSFTSGATQTVKYRTYNINLNA